MKKNKFLKISLIVIFCLLILNIFFPNLVSADITSYVPEVGIPGVAAAGKHFYFHGLNDFFTKLIIFVYRISFVIAFFMLIYTGFLYIFAGEKQANIKNALESLKFVGLGIGLMLFSYVILYTINPQLVKLTLFSFKISTEEVVAILPETINNIKIEDIEIEEPISPDREILISSINQMVEEGDIGGADYKGVLIDLKDNNTNVKSEIKDVLADTLSWYLSNNHHNDSDYLDIGPIKTYHANDPYGCSCHTKAAAIDLYVHGDSSGLNDALYEFLKSKENSLGITVIDERGDKQSTYSTSSHFHVQTKQCGVEWGKCMANH